MEELSSITQTQRRLKFQDNVKVKEHNYKRYAGLSDIEKRIIANRSSDDPRTLQNIHSRSVVSRGVHVKEHYKSISHPLDYHGHSNKRGSLQDKALNVGVLKWDHVDKWKHNHGGVIETGSQDSSSAGNNSLSSLASKLHYESYSPPTKQRASITSTVGFVPGEPNKERIVCLLSPPKPISRMLKKLPSTEITSSGNYSRLRPREEAKEISRLSLKDDDLYINSKPAGGYETKKILNVLHKSCTKNLTQTELYSEIKRTVSSMRSVESPNMPKNLTISDHKMENKAEKRPSSRAKLNYQVCPQKNENIIVLLNRDLYSTPSDKFLLPESQVPTDEVLECNWSSASDVLSERGSSLSNHVSELPQSSLPLHYSGSDGDTSTDPKNHPKVKVVHNVMVLPNISRSFSNVESSDFFCVQGRELNSEHREFSPEFSSLTSDHTHLDQAAQSSRHPSPLRHLSNGFSRMRKSFSSKDNSVIALSNSKRFPINIGIPSSPVVPFKDKSEAPKKARSSPLRRLIDPILKPKIVITSPYVDDQTGSAIEYKMLDKASENSSRFSQIERKKKDTVHALLQYSTKNGLPMFKFVAKKKGDALVATMANTSAYEKPDLSLHFTLYSVNEMTKNSSWKYQSRTGKNCGYLYSIIGQMKLCISSSSEITDDMSSSKHFAAVESTLFGVQSSKSDQETTKVKPSGELAALIIKTPNNSFRIRGNVNNGEKFLKEFSECLSEDRLSNMTGCCKRLSTTVILPAGFHSMPNKGAPSSLIHRWRSGGSCDCGGWDVGCNLSLLHNENDKECCEPGEQSQDRRASECFQLFSQTGARGKGPSFRLIPFNKGIYSVDFKPSAMSDLQAFFISLTVLSSLMTFDLSEGTE